MRLSVQRPIPKTNLTVGGVTTATTLPVASYGAAGDSVAINVLGHKWATFYIYVDAKHASTTKLTLLVQEGPDGTNWAPLQTEAVTSGVATLSDYVQEKTIAGTGLLYTAHVPVRWVRLMRLRMQVDAGTPTTVRVQYSLSGGPV